MRVAVIGTGHVGLVTSASLASIGHDVVGIDDDRRKVERLRSGQLPIYEPGLEQLVEDGVAAGRLRFTHDPAEGMPGIEVAFVCVGTPQGPEGEANLLAVEQAARAIGKHADRDMVVVHKSTVPIQTAERVSRVLRMTTGHRILVVSNPEFLREGQAVEDSLHPDRILVGSDDPGAFEVMRNLYAPLLKEAPAYFEVDLRTAELAKHACNAFLALKISYANALARICEAAGADVVAVADIMGADHRINRSFLNAGLGYGGYCFPKDVVAFRAQAARLGYEFGLLDEIVKINDQAVEATFRKVKDVVWNLEDKRIALFGLSFKAGTDDVRESPSLRLARRLLEAGAEVVGYDPQGMEGALQETPGLQVADDPYEAATRAHCAVIGTEWPEFAELDLAHLKGVMTHPIMVDARNLFDPAVMEHSGFTYIPTGRPPINA
jgi:UDPglucose 6-dehydrogenase